MTAVPGSVSPNGCVVKVTNRNQPHTGIVRLPDVPAGKRIVLMAQVIERYPHELAAGAILTVGTERIRISRTPPVSH